VDYRRALRRLRRSGPGRLLPEGARRRRSRRDELRPLRRSADAPDRPGVSILEERGRRRLVGDVVRSPRPPPRAPSPGVPRAGDLARRGILLGPVHRGRAFSVLPVDLVRGHVRRPRPGERRRRGHRRPPPPAPAGARRVRPGVRRGEPRPPPAGTLRRRRAPRPALPVPGEVPRRGTPSRRAPGGRRPRTAHRRALGPTGERGRRRAVRRGPLVPRVGAGRAGRLPGDFFQGLPEPPGNARARPGPSPGRPRRRRVLLSSRARAGPRDGTASSSCSPSSSPSPAAP
jgi:hypothetical protein